MRILVCDDETDFLKIISNYCERLSKEENIPITLIQFKDSKEVLSYYKSNIYIDVCILDIKMPELNGIDLAKRLRALGMRAKIVFLTAVLEFAPQGYEVGASRYWMKPLTYEKFRVEVQALNKEIDNESQKAIMEHIGRGIEKVFFDEIVYIETKERKTCVHKKENGYISTRKMRDYENKLDKRFFRCHAAYIVNMDYIGKVNGGELTLTTGDVIYISKGRKKRFMEEVQRYLLN